MADPVVVSLADRLRERRAELGISQSQAARELDVARTAYRLWEMDSARPAPDRWRLIARWLGISVSTLLLAEELMTQDEATLAEAASDLGYGTQPERIRDGAARDFFVEARGLLASALEAGDVSADASMQMQEVLDRIEDQRSASETSPWEATEMLRDLPADDRALEVATAGLRFVAAGIPERALDDAEQLMGALVAMSIQRAGGVDAGRVGVAIVVERDVLRVEVIDAPHPRGDRSTEPGDPDLSLLAQLASRWGGGTARGRRTTWFEIDLPAPGVAVLPV
jgi:transcriptional regulator with XRE-family HTH domain